MVGRRATPCEDSDACLGSSSFFFFFLFLNKKKPMVLCLMLDFIAFRAPEVRSCYPAPSLSTCRNTKCNDQTQGASAATALVTLVAIDPSTNDSVFASHFLLAQTGTGSSAPCIARCPSPHPLSPRKCV